MSLAKEALHNLYLEEEKKQFDPIADLKDAYTAAYTGKLSKRRLEQNEKRKDRERREATGVWAPTWAGSPYGGAKKLKTAHMDFFSSLRDFAKTPAWQYMQNLGWELAGSGSDIVTTPQGESIFEQFLTWTGRR